MSEPKRPYGSRFRDALVIVSPGACNPSGVALSIADACGEMREHEHADTKLVCRDPAIRLMVHQLAHLFGVAGAQYDLVHYMTDEAACKQRLTELGLSRSEPADQSRPLLAEVGGGRGVRAVRVMTAARPLSC